MYYSSLETLLLLLAKSVTIFRDTLFTFHLLPKLRRLIATNRRSWRLVRTPDPCAS